MAKNKQKVDITERLEAIKSRLRSEIDEQEKVLDQNFTYIQHNAGTLLVGAMMSAVKETIPLGFLGSLFSPFKAKSEAKQSDAAASKPSRLKQVVNEFLPVIAEIALPLLAQAGVSMLKKKFFRNK